MTSSRTLSNQSLLRRARQGSRSALNHLLERSRPVWLNRAERKSRGRSPGNSIPRTWSRSATSRLRLDSVNSEARASLNLHLDAGHLRP